MPRLIISERGEKQEWTHDCLEETISIGRMDDNIIVLQGRGVSRQHAQVVRVDDNFFVVDMGSGNGTSLNGTEVRPHEKNLLRNNDLISIDVFNLRFHTTDEMLEKSYNEEITDSDIIEVKLLKKVLRALDKETVPSLEVLNGVAEGKKIFLTDEMSEMVAGRDPSCELSINEFVISRKHAKINKRWGGIVIRDLESKNGTFINNRRVVEEFLHDGDRVALGTIVLLFRNPQEINLAHLTEKVPPKRTPAIIKPEDIPMPEEAEEMAEEALPEEAPPEEMPQEEEAYPPETFEEFEGLARPAPYPVSLPRKSIFGKLTPVEIGMIGLGVLVFVFALITLANLMFE